MNFSIFLPPDVGVFYIMDRIYLESRSVFRINLCDGIVILAGGNVKRRRIHSNPVTLNTGLGSYQDVKIYD